MNTVMGRSDAGCTPSQLAPQHRALGNHEQSQGGEDNVSEGWRTFHRLALALQTIQHRGNRDAVLSHLWVGHCIASKPRPPEESADVPIATKIRATRLYGAGWANITDVMMALHLPGKQLDLWACSSMCPRGFAKYRVVLSTRADHKTSAAVHAGSDTDAAVFSGRVANAP